MLIWCKIFHLKRSKLLHRNGTVCLSINLEIIKSSHFLTDFLQFNISFWSQFQVKGNIVFTTEVDSTLSLIYIECHNYFCLFHKYFYNCCLWDFFKVRSEFSPTTTKKFVIHNHFKTNYESVRSELSSCRVRGIYPKMWRIQDFPEGGGGCQPIALQIFCRKLHEYEKVGIGRGHTSLVPPSLWILHWRVILNGWKFCDSHYQLTSLPAGKSWIRSFFCWWKGDANFTSYLSELQVSASFRK